MKLTSFEFVDGRGEKFPGLHIQKPYEYAKLSEGKILVEKIHSAIKQAFPSDENDEMVVEYGFKNPICSESWLVFDSKNQDHVVALITSWLIKLPTDLQVVLDLLVMTNPNYQRRKIYYSLHCLHLESLLERGIDIDVNVLKTNNPGVYIPFSRTEGYTTYPTEGVEIPNWLLDIANGTLKIMKKPFCTENLVCKDYMPHREDHEIEFELFRKWGMRSRDGLFVVNVRNSRISKCSKLAMS